MVYFVVSFTRKLVLDHNGTRSGILRVTISVLDYIEYFHAELKISGRYVDRLKPSAAVRILVASCSCALINKNLYTLSEGENFLFFP